MYMSYCRFEGTNQELRACMRDVEEYVNGEAEEAASDREIKSFRDMVICFVDWLNDMALLDSFGELDGEGLEAICKAMAKDNTATED